MKDIKPFLVKVADIVVGERARKVFEIGELMGSIKNLGLIQPIVVERREDGRYQLLAGERRLKSCTLLQWEKIPCILKEGLDDKERLLVELEENMRRRKLEWPEEVELLRRVDELKREVEGEAVQGLSGSEGFSLAKLAGMRGKSIGSTSMDLKLAKALRDNPELVDVVKGMPKVAAMRKIEQEEAREKAIRMQEQGTITITDELIRGDCREELGKMEEGSVDLLLTDIPFGVSEMDASKKKRASDSNTLLYRSSLREHDNLSEDEMKELMKETIPLMYRVLRPSSHIYMFFGIQYYEFLMVELRTSGFLMEDVPIVWYKGRVTAPFRGYSPQPCYEVILFGHKPPREKRLNRPIKYLVEVKMVEAKDKLHVFEKPEELLELFIDISTIPGDVVLDPFAGSGSTLVAGKKMGRSVKGIEIDESNWARAMMRLGAKGTSQ